MLLPTTTFATTAGPRQLLLQLLDFGHLCRQLSSEHHCLRFRRIIPDHFFFSSRRNPMVLMPLPVSYDSDPESSLIKFHHESFELKHFLHQPFHSIDIPIGLNPPLAILSTACERILKSPCTWPLLCQDCPDSPPRASFRLITFGYILKRLYTRRLLA